jgi:hypothetical protein
MIRIRALVLPFPLRGMNRSLNNEKWSSWSQALSSYSTHACYIVSGALAGEDLNDKIRASASAEKQLEWHLQRLPLTFHLI